MTSTELRRLGVAGVLIEERSVLLVSKGPDSSGRCSWAPPGGKVEEGERLVDALRREMFEEVGLDVVVDIPLGVIEIVRDGVQFIVTDFLVRRSSPDQLVIAGDDAAFARWFPLDRLCDIDLVMGVRQFFERLGLLGGSR